MKSNVLRSVAGPVLLLFTCGMASAEIVTFEMIDVAVFPSTPPSSIVATTGQQIPGGFDNSAAGNEFHLSSLQFDIDEDLDPLSADPSIYFDFQIRTASFVGGQIVFDGFTHVLPPDPQNGSYVVTKGENSYLNLPFVEGDLIGDGADEFIRDGFRPPGPPENQTFSVALDEGGAVRQFIEGVDNFVGFVLDTGDYGWIRVQYDSTGGGGVGSLTFLDGAYDDSGAPIAAGDVGTGMPLSGDYDADADVDGDDYLVWRGDFGLTVASLADGNKDGVVNAADYVVWRKNAVANSAGLIFSDTATVPEPSAVALAWWLAIVSLAVHRRRSCHAVALSRERRFLAGFSGRWLAPTSRRLGTKFRLVSLVAGVGCFSCSILAAAPAAGPLRVHPENPRYFTDGSEAEDGSLRAVYLTGAHTWNNLVDMGRSDPPEAFDFQAYLDFLERHHHNFIRLWAWDSTEWDTRANGSLGKDFVHHVAPQPWLRSGPGDAADRKPKFDLTKFDPKYFERLRARVGAAGERGIYVSVMLFEGWGLYHGNRGRAAPEGWAWRTHPFHPDNNINDLKLDEVEGRSHRLGNAKVNELQAAYIRKVIDTVNDFDNVLYEVINEGGQKEWDWWVVETIRDHQRSKPKQHPIGITGHGAERLDSMLASPADWISPGRADGYAEEPAAWNAEQRKVSILDTDHIWGVGGNAAWVWKSICRGHNPIFMDPYDGAVLGQPGDKQWEPIYRALGDTRRFAERMNLARTAPHEELASTKYCLATPGETYLVYSPEGGSVTVDLSAAEGELSVEWFEPTQRETVPAARISGGGRRELSAPFDGAAVLFVRSR